METEKDDSKKRHKKVQHISTASHCSQLMSQNTVAERKMCWQLILLFLPLTNNHYLHIC